MSLVAIDFETYLICNEAPWPKPVCLTYHEVGQEADIVIGKDMKSTLKSMLESGNKIIAHNMSFEFNVIYKHFPSLRTPLIEALREGRLLCTKIYEQLIGHTSEKVGFKFGLSDLVNKYFDEDISAGKKDPDAWRLRYNELDGVPLAEWPSEALEYALSDSTWALRVYQAQSTLGASGLSKSLHESTRAECLLNYMGSFGIMVDSDRVDLLEKECKDKLQPMYDNLIAAGFAENKKGKYRKKMKNFREHIKEKVEHPNISPKGTIKTTSEDLKQYLEQTDDPIIRDFLALTDYEKVISAFVSRLKTAEPVIRCGYSATKSTGRTSSSTSPNMPSVNIQQMPREVPDVTYDVRNCFVPRKGYKIVSIDYAGLELASTGHQLYKTFWRSKMKDMINSGNSPVDMHSMFAYRLRNLSGKYPKCNYEEFVKNKKKETYKEFRQLAKPINLGFPGGIGYDTMRTLMAKDGLHSEFRIIARSNRESELKVHMMSLRKEFDNVRIARLGKKEWAIVVDELVRLKKALFDLYPELGEFLRDKHTRFTTGETKRMKNDYDEWEDEEMYAYNIYGMNRDWSTYTAFCNGYLMQTPAAIGAKRMMCEVIEKYIDDDRMNPLAFIHDEIVFEVLDTDDKYDIIKDVSEIMIDQMQTVLSTVRITVEAELMDYWMKAGGEWSKTYWKDAKSEELKSE